MSNRNFLSRANKFANKHAFHGELYSQALATILSSERLVVRVEQKAKTASFDLISRTIVIPAFSSGEKDVTDYYIAHEVAHSIYTDAKKYKEFFENLLSQETEDAKKISDPAESAKKLININAKKKMIHSIYNIFEDVRIEYLMKRRYPVLNAAFANGARILSEKFDFFKVNELFEKGSLEVFKEISLIDRINIFFKAGHHYDVPFDRSEYKWIDKANALREFDDVTALVMEFLEAFPDLIEGNDFDFDFITTDEGIPMGSVMDSEGRTIEISDFLRELLQKLLEAGDNSMPKRQSGTTDLSPIKSGDLIKGNFDENFSDSNNLKQQYLPGSVDTYMINSIIPLWKNVFVPSSKLNDIKPGRSNGFARHAVAAKPIINYMYQQFNLKKRAGRYSNVKTSYSGVIDTKKLSQYSIVNNIFAKKAIVKDSHNHGIVVMLDCSGSMSSVFKSAVTMISDLVTFCRKANIKFSVIGFVDSNLTIGGKSYNPPKVISSEAWRGTDYAPDSDLKLVEFYSSTMKPADIELRTNWLHDCMSNSGDKHFNISLGGTPLNDSLVLMPAYINEFKARNKIDIVSFVNISDGDSNGMSTKKGNFGGKNSVIIDSATGKTYTSYNVKECYKSTSMLLDYIRKTTDILISCIYVMSGENEKDIIRNRDSQSTMVPIGDTTSYLNTMGYDVISFIESKDIDTSNSQALIKNLSLLIDAIS